ncbi:hypothetical protein Tco_1032426 [Tanacetum coccineum]|uniref:Uncharacterized protein n=1 Tax=Tanacetum coccineum TaxID=301880 RepID=A0ABQ5GD98_9ASTR
METQKPLLKDEDGEEVDVLKKVTINWAFGSKRFSFDLVAYTDSDYAGTSLDRKSTTRDFLMILELLVLSQNRRDLPKDIPSERIYVLRYDTKGIKVRKGIMQNKTELTLEQTQQGVSDKVLFNSIKDAKLLMQAIEKSSKVLDQTFDMLQKLISQLEIHGEYISQEDVNHKFLRSLSLEWNTHTIKRWIEVAGGYANNEGKDILEEHWKKAYCEWGVHAREAGSKDPQENRNKENTRRVVPVERQLRSNPLISCDGLGDYDWSDQAEEGPTNFALMAYSFTSSNSNVSTDSNCSSSCLENVKILKEQNEKVVKRLKDIQDKCILIKTRGVVFRVYQKQDF